MTVATATFAAWLEQAQFPVQRLTPEQQALLQATFRFRQRQGADYYSTRILSHFLLHAQTGLKVAQIARLLGLSRPTASGHQDLSSKQVIQQAHHRLDGRPCGKLLPRFAGPIANFILSHPSATRLDLLDFIETTFSVRVSRIALYTTGLGPPPDVLGLFRQRQHHEQAYRVGVHDEFLDAVPCGYDKESPNPKRPRWQRGPLQMIGWLVALVYNAVGDLGASLAGDFTGSHVRALRRTFFNRPGTLYQTPEALIVNLDPFSGQNFLTPVIDEFNAAEHRIPWLGNRQLVLSLTPQEQSRAGP